MEVLDILGKIWPIGLAFITVVILFAKNDVRLGALEDKVKILFEFHNKK
jgi:hypothetical protein